MEGLTSLLVFGGLFYLMMRFGCGAHSVHGHHGGHSSKAESEKWNEWEASALVETSEFRSIGGSAS